MLNILTGNTATPNKETDGSQTVSLDSPGVAKAVSKQLLRDIDEYAIATFYEPHRWHLGASLIGHECSRYLWYVFRWCGRQVGHGSNDQEQTANLGRMQRLFNRGHLEEERVVKYLRGIGCEVWTHQEDGSQYRMSAVNGHFGGSIDGVFRFPARYNILAPVLWENKTNSTGPNFNKLIEDGVAVSKQQHFIQMSCYGKEYQLEYGAYFNTNKNDDNIHVEIVRLNWNIAEQMKVKAERIITSQVPPPKLSEQPTDRRCVYCDFKQTCHFKAPVERNCRSCVFAVPTIGGEWHCNTHGGTIPRDFVPKGCDSYKAITDAT